MLVHFVNSRNKGNRNQRKAIEYFESSGYLVSKAERTGKFEKEKDLFGLFDLACIKKGEMLLVQVTTNRPHTHKFYKEFSKKYHNNGVEFWQIVWYDRKGWRKFLYKLGNAIEYDERK